MRTLTWTSSGISFCTSDWLTVVAVIVGLGMVSFVVAAVLRSRTKTK